MTRRVLLRAGMLVGLLFLLTGLTPQTATLMSAEPAGGQAAQVDPAFDLFPVGPDDRDSIGSKNIGQDPPPDAFQLVQVVLAPG